MPGPEIRWPVGAEPPQASVHRRNTIVAPVPAEWVWEWLIRPGTWSGFYRNAIAVRCEPETLAAGVSFRWITFGLPITSSVDVFESHRRLGWRWHGPGAHGYHGWHLQDHAEGCEISTEETQFGPIPWALRPILGPVLSAGHQYWLRALTRVAATGPPGSPGTATGPRPRT